MKIRFSMYKGKLMHVLKWKKADLFCLNSNTWDVATCTCYC